MLDATWKKLVFVVACVILVFGSASVIRLRGNMPLASGLFTLAYLANAVVASTLCVRRVRQSSHLKTHWALFTTAVAWNVIVAIVALIMQPRPLVANFTTFFIFCGYVPLFLIVSLPSGRRYFHQFIWIDLIQATFAMYLGYSIIYQARPFTHDVPTPITGTALFHLFLGGDILTVMGALLHTLSAAGRDEKRFFCLFFFINLIAAVGTFIHNVYLLHNPKETLTGIPSLLVGFLVNVLILQHPPENGSALTARNHGLLADIINIASPALPSVVLFTLGLIIENTYPALAHAALLAAFILFVVRSTFYQRSFEILQRDLESARARMEELSFTDALTGVANRRAIEKALDSEWQHGIRSGSPLSFLLIDVDFFKTINDHDGHRAGDEYLTAIAGTLAAAIRRSIDLAGRYGGDEFAVILPSTDRAAAEHVAENICNAVRLLYLRNGSSPTGFATVSVGVATCAAFNELTPADLLIAADQALYEAKEAGRNGWRAR